MTKKEFNVMAEQARASALQLISEGNHLEWGDTLQSPLQETISTSQGGKEFVEKVTYDIYRGRERVELIYNAIYDSITDANYPKTLTEESMGPVQVVFVKTAEFEGVKFGRIASGETKVIQFFTYAAGIEITEDMIEYNETWAISDIGVAFGENYNKLLNHIHLDAIISQSYQTTGGGIAAQKAAQENGTPQLVAFATNVVTTLRNALSVLPRGTVILANTSDQFLLEDAIYGSLYTDNKTPTVVRRQIDPASIIYYDGEEVAVGDKVYEYAGVAQGFIYLIVPKRQYKERIKHDLRLSTIGADLTRLIAGGTVGRSRRAVYASNGGKYGAIKVAIA